MMKQIKTPRPHATGRPAALKTAALLSLLLALAGAARGQSAPTGPAGGDLAGTYPNPTLASDRVRKAGDSMTGALDISLPNPGGVFTPLTITTAGNSLAGRGTAFAFNVPFTASSMLGGKITTAWGSLGQTYISFGALNNSAVYGEVFRVDGRGYFGFNTANPTSRLHVVSGTDSATSMLALDTGTHGGTTMTVGGTAANESTFDLSVYRAGAYASRLGVNSAGHLYLQPGGGLVGVGTQTPGYTLDVVSPNQWAARFRKTDATNGGIVVESAAGYNPNVGLSAGGTVKWYVLSNSSNGDAFQLYESTGNSARFTLTQAGTVGIGTAAPNSAYKLDVAGSLNASGLCLSDGCKTSWSQVSGVWATSGTSAYYSAGKVGVGTASPGGQLTVTGASAAAGSVEAHIVNSTANGYQSLRLGTDSVATVSNLYLNAFNASWVTSGASMTDSGTIFGAGTGGLGLGAVNASGVVRLYTGGGLAGNERMRIDAAGNVGIGTQSPAARLDVNAGSNTATAINVTGAVNASGAITGSTVSATYQDVAEWVPSAQRLPAGTVVVLDAGRSNHVLASTSAYDTKVAGVVSAEPGVILGVGGVGRLKVATTGRVKVRADATRAPIRVGDLLVTSDVEGVAMKSEPVELGGVKVHRPGTIIGKALEPLEKGAGEILVLLSLQ